MANDRKSMRKELLWHLTIYTNYLCFPHYFVERFTVCRNRAAEVDAPTADSTLAHSRKAIDDPWAVP